MFIITRSWVLSEGEPDLKILSATEVHHGRL
jgi:hypothetical protein